MSNDDKLYRALQVHLDEQTVGFPSTESGSDLRLLRQLFPPEQVEAAMMLTYRYETLEEIRERAVKNGKSVDDLESILDQTARRGVLGYRTKDGRKQYRNIPYVVGMAEAAAHNPTPEFAVAAMAYFVDGTFWDDFLNSKVPQMRTIPVEHSVTPEHHVGSYDEVRSIIDKTDDPIAILACVCRKGAGAQGHACERTSRSETCMVLGDGARNILENGGGREIARSEALEILRKNGEDGLILQPSNAQGPDFICSCCGCCCGILKLHKAVSNPADHWATNFFAAVDAELCSSCGTCVESCQVNAMTVDEEDGEDAIPIVDLKRCLGCGNCAADCPDEAIELCRKESEVVPPLNGEAMNEVIMGARI